MDGRTLAQQAPTMYFGIKRGGDNIVSWDLEENEPITLLEYIRKIRPEQILVESQKIPKMKLRPVRKAEELTEQDRLQMALAMIDETDDTTSSAWGYKVFSQAEMQAEMLKDSPDGKEMIRIMVEDAQMWQQLVELGKIYIVADDEVEQRQREARRFKPQN